MTAEAKSRMPFVAPIRLRNLLWMPIVAGTWAALTIWGTPHLRWKYNWNGREASPVYHACDYVGLASFQISPADGKCPLVVLARAKRRVP